jgi:hypothetical protein
METAMHFLKAAAVIGTFVAGALSLSGTSLASPLASRATPLAGAGGAVTDAQYYEERRIYRPRTVVETYRSSRPMYRSRRAVRYHPVYGPGPRRVVRYHPIYGPVRVARPRPRTICRTRTHYVRTAYGNLVRRSVQRCIRRY